VDLLPERHAPRNSRGETRATFCDRPLPCNDLRRLTRRSARGVRVSLGRPSRTLLELFFARACKPDCSRFARHPIRTNGFTRARQRERAMPARTGLTAVVVSRQFTEAQRRRCMPCSSWSTTAAVRRAAGAGGKSSPCRWWVDCTTSTAAPATDCRSSRHLDESAPAAFAVRPRPGRKPFLAAIGERVCRFCHSPPCHTAATGAARGDSESPFPSPTLAERLFRDPQLR
jgi:hypothetical protein